MLCAQTSQCPLAPISTRRHTNTDVPQWKRPWTMALRSTIWIAEERTFNAIAIRLSSFNAWTQGSLNSVHFAEGLVCNAEKRASCSPEQCMERMTENQAKHRQFCEKNEMQFQTANKICEGAINAEQETEDRSAVKPKMLKVPGEPSESERRLHELTHLPYRDWCEHCVKLKGRQSHAVKKKNDR